MKTILTSLLLLFLLNCPARAAFLFDGSDYISVVDNTNLTLPDADWTICQRIKFTSRTGTTVRDIFHWETGTPFARIRIGDASAGFAINEAQVDFHDNDGTQILFTTSGTFWASNTSWADLCVIRSGGAAGTITLYANGVSKGSASNGSFDAVDVGAAFIIGNNGPSIGNTATFLGSMTDFGKWDRALSAGELTARSKGFAANCFPNSLKFNPPMIRTYIEVRNGIVITNSGTTISDQPALIYCGE